MSETRDVTATGEALPDEALAALQAGNKIEAIKALRQARGLSLKDAKDRVDAYLAAHPVLSKQIGSAQGEQARRFFLGLVIVAALAGAVYYFLLRS